MDKCQISYLAKQCRNKQTNKLCFSTEYICSYNLCVMTMSWIYSFVKINLSSAVYHFFLYTNRTVILFFKCQKNFGSALYTCIVSLYNNRTVILFFRVSNMQCTILYCSKPFIYFDDHTIMQTQQKNNNLIVNH